MSNAEPLTPKQRGQNYYRQSGYMRITLTSAQTRRLLKKSRKAGAKRFREEMVNATAE